MKKETKNKIILTILSMIYIPILLITLFVITFSGIDYSCKFTDLSCIMKNRDNDIIVYLLIWIINLSFILPIFKTIKNITKKDGGK